MRPDSAAAEGKVRGPRPVARGVPGASTRPAWVEIDLDALESNLAAIRRRVAPARVLAVIKADAYGHGARVVGRALERAGVDWLGVALVEEGIELREAGVAVPILVLEPGWGERIGLYARYRLAPTISSLAQLAEWEGLAGGGAGEPQPVHLKVDTGMSRLGVAPGEAAEALGRIRASRGLQLAGLLSHLAESDAPESAANPRQEERFAKVLELLDGCERERVLVHAANSAAALHLPASRLGLVRVGLALWGYDPARRSEDLEPVMAVGARIVQVRWIDPGTAVSYGGTWRAERRSRIGVVPVGYADGYPWRLGNRAEALVAGRRAPVVGRVTMDMTLLDLTDLPRTERGVEVVLLGRSGDDRVTAEELADRAGTIPYEVLCLLGLRLPRRYRRGGRVVAHDSRHGGGGG